MALQILGDTFGNPLGFLIFYLPILLLLLYGQRLQTYMILNEVSRYVSKFKVMKERARREAIDLVANSSKPNDPTERVDQFLEYFTILPVDLDPAGIVRKIEHTVLVRDDRVRAEIRGIAPAANPIQRSAIENTLEVAAALNIIYKIVRHFYLLGKRTTSLYVLIQLQMIMPLILQEADALMGAIGAFKQVQPIGDGIGAMAAAKMLQGRDKRTIARETVMGESEYKGRSLYLMKAEGPYGYVGQPGKAVEKLIGEMGLKMDAIIMIDAAVKLEGERTGDIAEGVGAAIGGIGVDRYKIEEVASRHGIPLYAIVIKQSIIEAISVMKKEIAEACDKAVSTIKRVIDEKTKEGDKVLIVGVGNTLGIAQ